MIIRAWMFSTIAVLLFSSFTIAEEANQPTCEPALSTGFDAPDGVLDLGSRAVIAIDQMESADVLSEIAQQAPEHYLTLLFLVAIDGKVQPTPANPLITTIFRGFDSNSAMEIQDFLNRSSSDESSADADQSLLYDRLWEKILAYRDSSDDSPVDSCAFITGESDDPTLWVAHETANCVRLVSSFESSNEFTPYSGLTEINLVRSTSQFVELDTDGWPIPITGARQAPQYSAEGVVFH